MESSSAGFISKTKPGLFLLLYKLDYQHVKKYDIFSLVLLRLSQGRKSLYNTAVYVRNIYIVCRNDYQQSKNWLCHILSSHLFETLFFYSYFIAILLKNIISWLTNYKITPGSLTSDTLTERCPGFFTCETFFVFFAWIIFAGALKFVMRNIYIFKRQ